MRRDERDGEFSACQTHREIFDAAALREKFRLPRESESDFIHSGLVNRPGHDGLELAAAGECDRLLERSCGGARSFRCRFAGLTIWLPAEDDVFSRIGNASRFQSELDNLRSDPGAIAKCDANALRRSRAHARDRNRICSLGTNRIGSTKKMKTKRKRKRKRKRKSGMR